MYSDLSKCFSPQDTLSESADNCRKNGCWRVNDNVQSVNKVNDGILLVFVADNDCNVVYQQLFNNVGSAIYIRRYWFGTWSDWVNIALKDDLPQSGRTPLIDCESIAITEFKVTFPKVFSEAPAIIVTPSSGTPGINGIPKYSVWDVTTTGFTIRIYNDDSEQRSPAFYWIAMAKS